LCATGSRMPRLPEDERYVRLTSLDRAGLSRLPSSALQSALDAYIQWSSSPPQEGSGGELSPFSRIQGRLTDAMVLALLGVLKSIHLTPLSSLSSQVVETDTNPQFRPHRAAILLRHAQSVFHPLSSASEISHILPLTQLDVPQRILVSFSKAIFWAWTQWNDARTAGIESILIWVRDSRLRPFPKI